MSALNVKETINILQTQHNIERMLSVSVNANGFWNVFVVFFRLCWARRPFRCVALFAILRLVVISWPAGKKKWISY